MSTKLTSTDFTSALAVGALVCLGVFFVVDHFMNLWVFFEEYSNNTTWKIVIALPVLIINYVAGVICINVAAIVFDRLKIINEKEELSRFISIAGTENEAYIQKYIDLERLLQFFKGCTLGFLILGIGTFFTSKWLHGYESFAYLFGVAMIVIAAACPFIAMKYQSRIMWLEKMICTNAKSSGNNADLEKKQL